MTDLISRHAAIEALSMNMPKLTTPDGSNQWDHEIQIADEAFVYCMKIIDDLPSAELVKHGKWIDIDEQTYTWKVRCSCCGDERSMMSTQGKYPNYCEACGARMDEE